MVTTELPSLDSRSVEEGSWRENGNFFEHVNITRDYDIVEE